MRRARGMLSRERSWDAAPGSPARGRGRATAPRDLVQLCAFSVGDELYAIDIMRIKEIINPLPITRVPKAPSFVEGVIELRGTILPIVDLRKRFDLSAASLTRASKFLIVAIDAESAPGGLPVSAADRWILGVVVDRVLEVIRIPREDIRATPAVTVDAHARYFSGVCRHRDRIVMLVDVDAILTRSERVGLAGLGHSMALPSPSLSRELEAAAGGEREPVLAPGRDGRGPGGGRGGL